VVPTAFGSSSCSGSKSQRRQVAWSRSPVGKAPGFPPKSLPFLCRRHSGPCSLTLLVEAAAKGTGRSLWVTPQEALFSHGNSHPNSSLHSQSMSRKQLQMKTGGAGQYPKWLLKAEKCDGGTVGRDLFTICGQDQETSQEAIMTGAEFQTPSLQRPRGWPNLSPPPIVSR
jgi:hypothetical protein